MGVDTRKPLLPAPTESSIQPTSGDLTPTELATDISRRTDRTSYSIPEDGSPVTISTRKRRETHDKDRESTLTRASHQSQTSLLIEYFEGGKGSKVHLKPSVRVKVTPSAARKLKDTKDHVQITEAGSGRKPSYTRRISLGPNSVEEQQIAENTDDRSISSYTSAAEESSLAGRAPPIEIEVMHRTQGSDLSGASMSGDHQIQQNGSEISSMPPDSMLEGTPTNLNPQRQRSRSISKDPALATKDTLKTLSRRRSRSLSRERITQKVIEKPGSKSREVSSGKHRHGGKSRSRSVSKEQLSESVRSLKRRSSRQHREDEIPSGAESSLLSTSQFSPKRKSGDQYSFRSGTSKSSLNNPKLLETVEDAIRRLILPELTALKHEQRTQQNRRKFEESNRDSIVSGSSLSRGEIGRRVSKHASAPDVSAKPKVVLNQDGNDPGTVLSGNSVKGKSGARREKEQLNASERSYDRGIPEEAVIRDDEKVPRKKSKDGHRIRDVAVGAIAGGVLTTAALRHHDSKSSIDKRERVKRRSKSRSRSVSISGDTEEIFQKHDVPPMPMRSEINESDLTRDSILSEQTSSPISERRQKEVRELSRGSPREVLSPVSRTPPRTPLAIQRGLNTFHSNYSREDATAQSVQGPRSPRSPYDKIHRSNTWETPLVGAVLHSGAAATANHLSNRPGKGDDHSYATHSNGRVLSPIQSDVDYKEDRERPNRDSFRQTHSSGSLSSLNRNARKNSAISIGSLSSAASTNFARSKRPQGINLENEEDILEQHGLRDSELDQDREVSRDSSVDEWYDRQHEQNEHYRHSLDDSSYRDSVIDIKHLTNYTDDSLDAPYLDKVAAAQHVQGVGANPEYIHTPIAVESAVASLHDSSILGAQSSQSARSRLGERSYLDSPNGGQQTPDRRNSFEPEAHSYEHEIDMRPSSHGERRSVSDRSYNLEDTKSPRQSVARSLDEEQEHIPMGTSGMPIPDDPLPEIGMGVDSESDINTNPSIIQGPGLPHDDREPWLIQSASPRSREGQWTRSDNTSAHNSLKAAAAVMLSAAAGVSAGKAVASRTGDREKELAASEHEQDMAEHDYEHSMNHDFGPMQDSYTGSQPIPTPTMNKDEGYISAPNARSPGAATPDQKPNRLGMFEDEEMDDMMDGDDPFLSGTHARHLSGNSHGMPSPLYDSATGRGIDRIQSKDVVALMDHLTVRDAQRNARDTEILVTLVRSAAEMRNSFEDMKKFIAEQDEMLIDSGNKQHERTAQKIIGGPRPQPFGTPRLPRRTSAEDEVADDMPAKRRNVFKRALRGLSMRGTNDLGKIEDMLVQLLGDVEGLKTGQDLPSSKGVGRSSSMDSFDDRQPGAMDGYEPEGQAGTGSSGNQSGYFSNPSLRQGSGIRTFDGRRASQNRVSTVLEGDEELEEHEQNMLDNQFENNEHLLTPTQEHPRGASEPTVTPPNTTLPIGTQSNEHTPRTTTDKSRKHKSSSSSFFPKISRWSKTTASSAGDNFRNSGRKERPFSEASRSGSDLNYNPNDIYDPHGDDRHRSNDSLEQERLDQEDRPPSPLIPSQVSENPKYQAHRNSLNLQHPQPRPGQRYQHHLETQAQNFGSPISPNSDQFGSNPSLARFVPGNGARQSAGNLSPISDGGYSETSAVSADQRSAPPRPPKISDDGPLVPQRPPKIATDDRPTYGSPRSANRLAPAGEDQRYSNASSGYEGNGSPRSASGQVPQRKPTGPRPISTSGNYSAEKMESPKKSRY